ncbi:PAX transactivation activation domain-interacting protein [Aphelenchoides fujianensis]|nr:PAX transactivation activation domain-interacting protein [Aphelenchoides fujianensis]
MMRPQGPPVQLQQPQPPPMALQQPPVGLPPGTPQHVHPQLQQQQSVEMARRMMHHPATPIGGLRNGAPMPPAAMFGGPRMPGQPLGMPPVHPAMMQRMPPNAQAAAAARMRIPQYYGQIVQSAQPLAPELFLAGCCFVIEEFNAPGSDKQELEARLRFYGADVEHNLTAAPIVFRAPPPPRVTHILCDTLTMKIRQQVLRYTLPQRLVTSNWLADALAKKKVEPPSRASHLPTTWSEEKLPGADKVGGIY